MNNIHHGSSLDDFLKEQKIKLLCKLCRKEQAKHVHPTFKILMCDECHSYGTDSQSIIRIFFVILERLQSLENKIEMMLSNQTLTINNTRDGLK